MSKWSKIERTEAPINPHFCPVLDPDTEEKCNKFMRKWDLIFYQKYGMCEDCFNKYNSHVDEIAEEWVKQTNK